VPFPRHFLEGIFVDGPRLSYPSNLCFSRIVAGREQAARRVALFARLGKRDVGMGAEVKLVLLAIRLPVLHAPQFAASRRHLEVQPTAIKELVWLVFRLRVPDLHLCQGRHTLWHFGGLRLLRPSAGPERSPQMRWLHEDFAGQYRTKKNPLPL
jgi:hypothetical protein